MFKAQNARKAPCATMSFVGGCTTKSHRPACEDKHLWRCRQAHELLDATEDEVYAM